MPETTTRAERVRATLDRDFAPVALEIVDESHRHAGHAGAAAAGETHYAVLLNSPPVCTPCRSPCARRPSRRRCRTPAWSH
jgi:hypothetical protein